MAGLDDSTSMAPKGAAATTQVTVSTVEVEASTEEPQSTKNISCICTRARKEGKETISGESRRECSQDG
ncbi:hypothetical protein ACJZ2D_015804 [Fusarium nematophilum]